MTRLLLTRSSTGGGPAIAPRLVVWSAIALLIGPFAILPIRAFADEWRAPNIIPQRFGLRGVTRVLQDGLLVEAVANSVVVGIVAAVIGVGIGWPAARSLASLGTARLAWLAILLPLLLPPLVVGEGLRVWFLRLGLADSLGGLVLAHLVFVMPYCIMILTPGFTPELLRRESAAMVLTGDLRQRFFSVTLPAMRRQVALALALGFTISWAQYGTSLGVGGGVPMLPLLLVPLVRADPQVAAVLDVVLITPPLIALAISQGLRTKQTLPI